MKNRRTTSLYLLVSALAVLISCDIFAASLDELQIQMLKKNYAYVIREVESMQKNQKTTDAYYLQGLAYLKLNQNQYARDSFNSALKLDNNSKMKNKIYLSLGDSYFLDRDFTQALNYYDKALKNSPSQGIKPLIYLRCAQCNIKSGNWDKGQEYLKNLNREFPASFENKMSESLSSTNEFFCVQVGSFSSEANAINYAKKLKTEGFNAYVSKTTSDLGAIYRVRVGECRSVDEAENLNTKLKDSGYETKIYP